MNSDQSKTSVGSTASALLAHGSIYGQLAWVELTVERRRLMKMLLLMLFGFSLLTGLLVLLTIILLLASWNTPNREIILIVTGVIYCVGIISICLGFSALARKGKQTFSNTREELAEDFELIRSRLER